MITAVGKWFDPKPGHEFQYRLAMKHRHQAGEIMSGLNVWIRLFRPSIYRRAYRLWASAVDRMKIHGQDRVLAHWR